MLNAGTLMDPWSATRMLNAMQSQPLAPDPQASQGFPQLPDWEVQDVLAWLGALRMPEHCQVPNHAGGLVVWPAALTGGDGTVVSPGTDRWADAPLPLEQSARRARG